MNDPVPTEPAPPVSGGGEDRLTRVTAQLEKIGTTLGALGSGSGAEPTGEVTLGESAGTLGGWLAHRQLAVAADQVADAVRAHLPERARVLVVEARDLLGADVSGAEVRDWLGVTATRLTSLAAEAEAAAAAFARTEPAPPVERPTRPSVTGLEETAEEPSRAAASGTGSGDDGAGAGAGGVAGALLGFLALAREDYELGAVAVTAGAGELGTLVAGGLSRRGAVDVEVDGFRTARDSPTMARYRDLVARRAAVGEALAPVTGRVAALQAEADALTGRLDAVETAWAAAVASKEAPAEAAAGLRARIVELERQRHSVRTRLAPIAALVADRTAVLQEVHARLTSLTTPPVAGGPAPLAEAVRYERLAALAAEAPSRVTHVLYVRVDALGGDKVTRTTSLGEPGRLGFLGSVNASWLLADAVGTVVGGGAAGGAARLTYDLGSGAASLHEVDAGGGIPRSARDVLAGFTPVVVVAVILAVLLLAAAPILEVVLAALTR